MVCGARDGALYSENYGPRRSEGVAPVNPPKRRHGQYTGIPFKVEMERMVYAASSSAWLESRLPLKGLHWYSIATQSPYT
ncbi:hypothetical protein M408DRAFT_202517 [Serendipita vermifera MAFF 305830]|uniref:Uncharacterized protein n=1 Tax=Serendipita vermifera MAFF 305830 TaxID=933852 RepID=A0A0C2X9M5_SERVB|nr:hypothetical protein M408DRAFT_202517 [Serendipita vermifera MAFF 305830]